MLNILEFVRNDFLLKNRLCNNTLLHTILYYIKLKFQNS